MRSWLNAVKARRMSPTEAAWFAGFFDGEGTLASYLGGRGRKHLCWGLQIPNTDLCSLEHCKRITGAGNIQLKHRADGRKKDQWVFRITAQRDLVVVLSQVREYLVIKKDGVTDFLASWQDLAA